MITTTKLKTLTIRSAKLVLAESNHSPTPALSVMCINKRTIRDKKILKGKQSIASLVSDLGAIDGPSSFKSLISIPFL